MIYTVTFNPSIDYYVRTHGDLRTDVPNRITDCRFAAGGKGINVLRALKAVGGNAVDARGIGFAAGFTGELLADILSQEGLRCDFVRTEGRTRMNVKICGGAELNAAGQTITKSDLDRLLSRLEAIGEKDVVVISGSTLPCDVDLYGETVRFVKSKGALCVCDTTGNSLVNACESGVFLVKPNVYELEEITGGRSADASGMLCAHGTKILLSDGENGAYLITQGGVIHCGVPVKKTPLNTVGAGDSMLAGFIYGYCTGMDDADCLKSAVAAGTSSVYTPPAETLKRELYEEIFKKAKTSGL